MPKTVVDPTTKAQILHLNGCGLDDTEIGRRLGLHQTTVRYHRAKAGLPTKGQRSPVARSRRWSTIKEQLHADGFESLTERRWMAERIAAARAGWPPEALAVGVKVLDALERHGPMDRAGLAKASGTMVNRDRTRRLVKDGLVTVKRGANGRHVFTLAVKRQRATRGRPNYGLFTDAG